MGKKFKCMLAPQSTDTQYYNTIHRYPIFSTSYSVMCKVYIGYHGTSEIEHGLYAIRSIIPSLKLRDYLSVQAHKPCSVSQRILYSASLLDLMYLCSSILPFSLLPSLLSMYFVVVCDCALPWISSYLFLMLCADWR